MCSSHRFRGDTPNNPLNGSIKYMRHHGIDREIAIAGDSHVPEIRAYADGPLSRLAINCGSLQTDSGYAKRNFTPYTHTWMPVVVFYPDVHLMVPYQDLKSLMRHRIGKTRGQRRPASQETCRDTEKTSTGGVSRRRLQTHAGVSRPRI